MKGDFHCFCNFNWRISPLQYWVGFCCTTTRISHNYIWTVLYLVAQSGPTLCDPMNCSLPASSVPGDSPDKTTGVGCHFLHQGIFPTQGLNPSLLYCRQILYWLSHQGSPRIVEWVAYPFSGGSSQPRNRTGVSCIAGGFFTSWPARKAQNCVYIFKYIYISPLPLEPPHLLYLKALCKQPSDISCDSRCWCTRLDIVFLHIYLHFTLNNSNKRSTFVAPPFIWPVLDQDPAAKLHTPWPPISSPQFCPNSLWCWEPWGILPCKPWW